MGTKLTLSDAIDNYLTAREAMGVAGATRRQEVHVLRAMLTNLGNVYAHNITPKAMDRHFGARRDRGLAQSTLNHELAVIKTFFKFAQQRKWITGMSPVEYHKARKFVPRERTRVPASKFPALLDACEHPRDRVIVAVGLYTFIRQAQMKLLRVESVDLDDGYVEVVDPKTFQRDAKPISTELDAELRRWMVAYSATLGRPLRPDDYLVPAKARATFTTGGGMIKHGRLDPTRPVSRPHYAVQQALAALGYATIGEGEGVHTLRRSAARAMFDVLVADGHDGAIRIVQSMLGHSTIAMTERYIGAEPDRRRRDDMVRGRTMFPTGDNVVQLRRVHDA